MIPMGTIVTACMLLGIIAGVVTLLWPRCHGVISKGAGVLVLFAGAWNVLWYWLRHPTQYWGLAALVTGLLMIAMAYYLLADNRVQPLLRKLKPLVLVLLSAGCFHYANTIYQL